MTGKAVAAVSSLAVALVSAGCLSFYEVPVETPIRAKLDVSPFDRVLVAGFLSGGSRNLDPNSETARVLRSAMRSKSDLRIIDADVIDLVEEYDKIRAKAGEPPTAATVALTAAAAAATPDKPGDKDPVKIRDERDLQEYEAILKDEAFWKKIGEEYNQPLIITGSVLFSDVARSGMQSRLQSYTDSMGRPMYEEKREFANMKGFALNPKVVFIDGRTGAQLYAETFSEEQLYPDGTNTPALSSYFEMMDKILPALLNTLSTQRVRGTRILLIK